MQMRDWKGNLQIEIDIIYRYLQAILYLPLLGVESEEEIVGLIPWLSSWSVEDLEWTVVQLLRLNCG